jgi:RNA polymerase sigma-70 factor (ECF subfamily)
MSGPFAHEGEGMPTVAVAKPRRRINTRDQLVAAFQEARPDLVSTLYHLLGNYADAQDATQEAFVKCWRSYRRLAKVRNYRAWIFRVGLNAAKDLRRNAWRRRIRPLTQAPPVECADAAPDDAFCRCEDVDRLRGAVKDLRRQEKEVFLLRQNGDLTYEQIAVACRRPVGTVKTQMRTALIKLRGVLAESRC